METLHQSHFSLIAVVAYNRGKTGVQHMFLAWVPFLVFAGVFTLGMLVLVIFAKTARVKVDGAGPRQTVHLEHRFVSLDVRPQDRPNPELAGVLIYPGAASLDKGVPGSDLEIHLLNKTFRAASASYWTSDPPEIVWEFYRRELPDWHESVNHGSGRELLQSSTGGNLKAIRVYPADGRTMIETGVKPASYIDYRLP
jgi:hypothetical protein